VGGSAFKDGLTLVKDGRTLMKGEPPFRGRPTLHTITKQQQ